MPLPVPQTLPSCEYLSIRRSGGGGRGTWSLIRDRHVAVRVRSGGPQGSRLRGGDLRLLAPPTSPNPVRVHPKCWSRRR
jgi:hypothetical protein